MDAVWVALALSLKVAGLATLVTMVLGITVGFLLARANIPGRNLLDTILTLPMVLPPTVLGYYLLVLLGRRSTFGAWLLEEFGINLIFTWQAAVIAASVVSFPLVFKPARAAFESVDGQWSRQLGHWVRAKLRYFSESLCLWLGVVFWREFYWRSHGRLANSAQR